MQQKGSFYVGLQDLGLQLPWMIPGVRFPVSIMGLRLTRLRLREYLCHSAATSKLSSAAKGVLRLHCQGGGTDTGFGSVRRRRHRRRTGRKPTHGPMLVFTYHPSGSGLAE